MELDADGDAIHLVELVDERNVVRCESIDVDVFKRGLIDVDVVSDLVVEEMELLIWVDEPIHDISAWVFVILKFEIDLHLP